MYPATHAQADPGKPAVVMVGSGRVVTYRELDDESARLARVLRERGLTVGDRIAVLMDNDPRFLTVCWAAQRSGLYYVPVNWHLTPGEVQYIVESSGAKAIVANAALAETAAALLPQCPLVGVALAVDVPIAGFDDLDAALAAQPGGPLEGETDGAEMIYSSGTTGRPKGGKRPLPGTHPAVFDPSRYALVRRLGLSGDMVYLTPGAPLYHAAPLRYTMRATRLGATNVVLERFDAKQALAAIERYRVTHSQWVPTMFVRLLRLAPEVRSGYDLSSQRVAFHAAAPCPINVKRQMIEWWGPIVHEYYGGSEGGIITYISPREWLERPGSVGRPIVGKLHILDDAGRELPPGQPGLVYAQDGVPIEYLDDPEKTAAAHDDRGWATVGDVGFVDEDGYLYLTDRRDHVIISGGVNIYPQEVEDVLVDHAEVADAAVIGVPHDEYGEEVKAVVELVEPGDATAALATELIDLCRGRLAAYKCPRSVDFVDELPRAPSGKLYKRRLRERYWQDRDSLIT